MNCAVVALPPAYFRAHPRTIRQNVLSPTAIRNASNVAAPRRYDDRPKTDRVVGSAGGSGGMFPAPWYKVSSMSFGVSRPSCSDHNHSAYVAKPSFSQTSDQSATDTLSPNHWCASSCAITVGPSAPRKNDGAYVGRVWFSNANLIRMSSCTTPPTASNGYGPNLVSRKSSTCGVSASAESIDFGNGAATASTTGSPSWVVVVTRYLPIATNAR